MSNKNFGFDVTFLNPDKRAFRRVVFRPDKPVSHSELGLLQDLQDDARIHLFQKNLRSGFLTGDFFCDTLKDFQFGTESNTFYLVNKPVVNVAGRIVHLEYTGTDSEGLNVIELHEPDPSPGSVAVDFVYLEVWDVLVLPEPSSLNKPDEDKIYPHGNVLAHQDTWLDDDMLDNPVASTNNIETSSRVQTQYAIRTVRLLNNDNIDGYVDDHVEVQGPNNNPITNLKFTKHTKDGGLWVGGDALGEPDAVPNTVDGYVYSIPLAIVYRRNSAGFDAQSNGNGGVTGVGIDPSDRPDGLFADQVVKEDLLDLRHAVDFGSVDWSRVLEKNVSLLLDNELGTWVGRGSHTGWYVGGSNESFGTSYLKADVIQSKTSPDGPSGNITAHPDGFLTTYSDRSVLQGHVHVFSKGSAWEEDDTLVFDFTQSHPLDPLEDIAYEQPSGTIISDVLSVRLNNGDMPHLPFKKVEGLGTKTVTITLDDYLYPSDADIWVDYEIQYPAGNGLTSNVKAETSNFRYYLENPSAFNSYFTQNFTDDDTGRQAIDPYIHIDFGQGSKREVTIQYHSDIEDELTTFVHGTSANKILLPHIPYIEDFDFPNDSITVEIGGDVEQILSINGREITLVNSFTVGDEAEVTYQALKPLPINGAIFTLYYLAPSIQAIPFEYLQNPDDIVNHSLEIEPVYLPPYLYVGTTSSGSVITSYPYEAPLNQIPVSAEVGIDAYEGEEELSSSGAISIDDFDGDVGLLRLNVLVPLANVETLKLMNPVNVTGSVNLEYVDHYLATDEDEYLPAVFAQSLSTEVEHKTFYPFLAVLKRDTDFARKGSVVLVVMTQYYDYSDLLPSNIGVEENRIAFNSKMTCAAIYKVKGNWITKTSCEG